MDMDMVDDALVELASLFSRVAILCHGADCADAREAASWLCPCSRRTVA